MMSAAIVYALVLWNGTGQARGDYFSKVELVMTFPTEQACQYGMALYAQKISERMEPGQTTTKQMSCEKVTNLTISGTKPPAKSWTEWLPEWWRTH